MPARHALTILAVDDLPRAIAFYEAAFGWPRIVNAPVYAEFSLPEGMRFGLYERVGFGRNTGQVPARLAPAEIVGTELYFYVDDVHEAVLRLLAAGARRLSDLAPRDWGDEAAYFADPAGNVIAVARPLATGAEDTPARLREIATRWMTLWQGADLNLCEVIHAADFVDRSATTRGRDRAAFRAGIAELRTAFPDFHARIDDLLIEAGAKEVTIRWSAMGTHRGEFLGVAGTGRTFRISGIEILRVQGGKIVERWGEWDGLGLLGQLRHSDP
jgi:steroid delta-isomerase-like uncharacterized protein